MPFALLASPIFLAALNFLISGGLDLARREFTPGATKPTLGEVLPVAGATAAGAFAGPIGGAIGGAAGSALGAGVGRAAGGLAQVGLTTAVPLEARALSSQANPDQTMFPSIAQTTPQTSAQALVQYYQNLAAQQQAVPAPYLTMGSTPPAAGAGAQYQPYSNPQAAATNNQLVTANQIRNWYFTTAPSTPNAGP